MDERAVCGIDGFFSTHNSLRAPLESISGEFGLGRDELTRTGIFGLGPERAWTSMELLLRCSEAGERFIVIDMAGRYAPLLDYLQSLRIYRVGMDIQARPFSASRRRNPEIASAILQATLGLSRSERAFLEMAQSLAYSEGVEEPTVSDIKERLLQVEAEAHPRHGFEIDMLRNMLWEIRGLDIRAPQRRISAPAVIDTSRLKSIREGTIAALDLFLNLECSECTAVLIDPAERIFLRDPPRELSSALEEAADGLAARGKLLIASASNILSLPKWLADTLTSKIHCGPLSQDFGKRANGVESTIQAPAGKTLVLTRSTTHPALVDLKRTKFRDISDQEVVEHMKSLGEYFEPEPHAPNKERLLERIFRDEALLHTAKELLRLVRGGRVPVDAVEKQRSGIIRRVVKALSKHFLIVEFTDGGGIGWYKLTKVGERALDEVDGNEGETDL